MSRAAGSFTVACRVRGHNTTGRLYDLTREGALLDSGNGFMVAGDHVALRFESGVRVAGRVTLLHGRIARVEFESPLHEAVYEHITRTQRSPTRPEDRCFTRSHRIANAARRIA
jgi:hypothetical protein